MDQPVLARPDLVRLLALAEQIERDSRDGRPVAGPLAQLRDTVVACGARRWAGASVGSSEALDRMPGVVEQVRRDVDAGHVRSISGLVGEARRFARELDDCLPAVAA